MVWSKFDFGTPESFYESVKSFVQRQWVVCFVSALVCGFAAHFYKLVNWLPNWDSLVFRYSDQNMTELGRWFLFAACLPSSFYDLPWVCSVLCLVYVAAAAVCLCYIFRFKSVVSAALLGGIATTFPTITSTLTYNYVADGYALALVFSTASAWMINSRLRHRYVMGILLLTMAMGIYQPYLGVTMMILVLMLIDGIVFQREDVKASLIRAGRFAFAGVCACALYVAILKVALVVGQKELSEYIVGEGPKFPYDMWLYPACVFWRCVKGLIRFFMDFRLGFSLHPIVGVAMFAMTAWFTFRAATHDNVFRHPLRTTLLALYVLAIPVCASPLYILSPYHDYHNLMRAGFLVIPVFFLTFYERRVFRTPRYENLKSWIILVVGLVMIYNYALVANISYHKLQMTFLDSFGEVVRIADRIEQTPGAEKCRKLAVLGVKPDSKAWSANVLLDVTGVTDGSLLRPDDYTVNQSVITTTINDYAGKNYVFATRAERLRLAKDPRVLRMPFWPAPGSIAVVDKYLVLRLSPGAGLYD